MAVLRLMLLSLVRSLPWQVVALVPLVAEAGSGLLDTAYSEFVHQQVSTICTSGHLEEWSTVVMDSGLLSLTLTIQGCYYTNQIRLAL